MKKVRLNSIDAYTGIPIYEGDMVMQVRTFPANLPSKGFFFKAVWNATLGLWAFQSHKGFLLIFTPETQITLADFDKLLTPKPL